MLPLGQIFGLGATELLIVFVILLPIVAYWLTKAKVTLLFPLLFFGLAIIIYQIGGIPAPASFVPAAILSILAIAVGAYYERKRKGVLPPVKPTPPAPKEKAEPPKPEVKVVEVRVERRGSRLLTIGILLLFLVIIGLFVLPRLWILPLLFRGTPLEPIFGAVIAPPKIRIYRVDLVGYGPQGFTVKVTLEIYNPNPMSITIDRGEFKIYVDGRYIGDGDFPMTTIGIRGIRHMEVSTQIEWVGGLQALWGSILRIEGTAFVDVPVLGTIGVPFSYERRI